MIDLAIARYLDSLGIVTLNEGATAGGNISYGGAAMPDDDLAVRLDEQGGNPLPGAGTLPYDEPTVHALIRSVRWNPRPGRELAKATYGALQGFSGVLDPGGDAEAHVVRCIARQTAPVSIGLDENQRAEWSLNFDVQIHAPTVHRTG